MKVEIVEVEEVPRMSYGTYEFFMAMLEKEREVTDATYRKACMMFIDAPNTAKKKATERYHARLKFIRSMETELKFAAKAAHKDNPNLKLREFWGV